MRQAVRLFAVVVTVSAVALVVHSSRRLRAAEHADGETVSSVTRVVAPTAAKAVAPENPLEGLDLTRITLAGGVEVAPLPKGRTAQLTLDPTLQETVEKVVASHKFHEAAVVMIDAETGDVIAYASSLANGAPRDLCIEATAPPASLFKIVTASALIRNMGAGPETRECYRRLASHKLIAQDLIESPARDHICSTMAIAMGKSINPVFARLASHHLTPPQLLAEARQFGFGEPFAFDVPVQMSRIDLPSDPLGFAQTAAGFWHTTISPIAAASMSTTIARGGETIRPRIVRSVLSADKRVIYTEPPPSIARAMPPTAARSIATMMEATVRVGTARRAFHPSRASDPLRNIVVAGKTGTLTDRERARFYTWFTGFAPVGAADGNKRHQVSIAVLVVNGPVWHTRATTIAHDLLGAAYNSRTLSAQPALSATIAAEKRPASP